MSSKRTLTFEPKAFNIDNLVISPIDEGMISNAISKKFFQTASQVAYKFGDKQDKCCFKTDEIVLKSNPIVGYNENTIKTFKFTGPDDSARLKINIPLDDEQQSCIELKKMFESVDEYIAENCDKLLPAKLFASGDNKKKRLIESPPQQTPCIKVPKPKEGKPTTYKAYDALKVKLIRDFATKNILTKLFVKESSGAITEIKVDNIDDIERYVKFGSTIKFVGDISKFTYIPNGAVKYFGATVLCQQIFVTKLPQVKKQIIQENLFDDEPEKPIEIKEDKKTSDKKTKEKEEDKKKVHNKKKVEVIEEEEVEEDEEDEVDIIDEDNSVETPVIGHKKKK